MDDWLGKPLLKSMVSQELWKLREAGEEEQFQLRIEAHFARGYPDWVIVSAEHPFVYLKDGR